MEQQKEQIEVECHLCKHKWSYKGKSKYWITCPRCMSKTKSPRKEINIEIEELE